MIKKEKKTKHTKTYTIVIPGIGTVLIPKKLLGAFRKGHLLRDKDQIEEEFSIELLKKCIQSNWTDKDSYNTLLYLVKFNNEYHKNVIKKSDPKGQLHKKELREAAWENENAKNRCISTVKKYIDKDKKRKYIKQLPTTDSFFSNFLETKLSPIEMREAYSKWVNTARNMLNNEVES